MPCSKRKPSASPTHRTTSVITTMRTKSAVSLASRPAPRCTGTTQNRASRPISRSRMMLTAPMMAPVMPADQRHQRHLAVQAAVPGDLLDDVAQHDVQRDQEARGHHQRLHQRRRVAAPAAQDPRGEHPRLRDQPLGRVLPDSCASGACRRGGEGPARVGAQRSPSSASSPGHPRVQRDRHHDAADRPRQPGGQHRPGRLRGGVGAVTCQRLQSVHPLRQRLVTDEALDPVRERSRPAAARPKPAPASAAGPASSARSPPGSGWRCRSGRR